MTIDLSIQESAVKSLYTLDEAREQLHTLSNGSVKWTCNDTANEIALPSSWPEDFAGYSDWAISDASLKLDGHDEVPLTKAALLQLTKKFGLSSKYVLSIPTDLLKPHIDYWLSHSDMDLRLLTKDDFGVGFSKSPLASTVHADYAFESVVEALKDGTNVSYSEILVDYKFTHTLDQTVFRLIQPNSARKISSLRDGETEDLWHWGVQVSHSTTAQFPTSLEGYMFAWWCTNGAIATHGASTKFDRRSSHDDDWLLWVQESMDDMLVDTPKQLDDIQSLTEVNLKGELSDAAESVFKRYKIPRQARSAVLSNLVESDDWTAYGLMNAVTQAANPVDTPETIRNVLFRAGGDMAVAFSERCETCHRL